MPCPRPSRRLLARQRVTLVPGAPATYAVWDAGELVTAGSDSRVQRWSTDPRSGVPALPDVSPGAALPKCLRTVLNGRTIYTRPEDDDGFR